MLEFKRCGETMQELQNRWSKELFGMSISEAQEKKICLCCKEEALPRCYSNAGVTEYSISGLCEICFDKISDKGE